jgi:hypothetical protein
MPDETEVEEAPVEETEEAPAAPAEGQAPNIIFVGKLKDQVQTKLSYGYGMIKLPKVEEQADIETEEKDGVETHKAKGKPFYHEEANAIIQGTQGLYKAHKAKG